MFYKIFLHAKEKERDIHFLLGEVHTVIIVINPCIKLWSDLALTKL